MPEDQLKMFMTGPEIKAYARIGEGEVEGEDRAGSPAATASKLWNRKLKESKAPGPLGKESLASSIASGGVKDPVEIMHHFTRGHSDLDASPMIWNGHHRVAVTSSLHPDQFLPVIHHDSVDEDAVYRWNRAMDPSKYRVHPKV